MIIALSVIILLSLTYILFMQQAQFGKLPEGARLEKIKKSPNYRNDAFQNESITPQLTEGANFFSMMNEFFFKKRIDNSPLSELSSVKTDFLSLDIYKDVLIWFGHSSYFMQIDGKRMLVDPVLSGYASPFSFTTKAFKGTNIYLPDDIPEIDYLFLTHDHWDHLDYKALQKLKPKIKKIICPLGVGQHLERWGFDLNIIIEKDWNEQIILDNGFTAYTTPARHFSGRTFKRNQSLWTAYVLQTPTMKLFIGGDSGYDKHFAEIGKTFGPFDLAILENGQYSKSWRYIHMSPDEVLRAAKDLQAKRMFPVHSSKFALSLHPWYEPLTKITELNKEANVSVITPMIGEPVNLIDTAQKFSEWWETVR